MRSLLGSVRVRLTVGVTAVAALALTLASVLFVRHVQSVLVDDVQTSDRAALEALRAEVAADGPPPAALSVPADRPGTAVQLVDPAGRVVAGTPGAPTTLVVPADRLPLRPPPGRGARPPWVPPAARGEAGRRGPGSSLPATSLPGAGEAPTTVPADAVAGVTPPDPAASADRPVTDPTGDLAVTSLEVPVGSETYVLVAATSLAGVSQSVDTLGGTLTLAVPVLVVLVGALAWFVTGRALRPVDEIAGRVEGISAGTLHERVPVPRTDDEIAHLARTMNAMLQRLDDAAARQRRFVSDASHELRSPVAAIRTELEVALARPEQAAWPEVATRVLAEDERLALLVGDLLLLARADEEGRPDGGGADALPEVDLDDVVRGEATRSRRSPVGTAGVAPARVVGRQAELERLVRHLVDNAARHARARVEVATGVGPGAGGGDEPGWAWLTVDDDGRGVPADERALIFERFGRLDEGRSRDHGGAGLGLAVVRAIAQRHGGTVDVEDGPLGGARFVVRLPVAGWSSVRDRATGVARAGRTRGDDRLSGSSR